MSNFATLDAVKVRLKITQGDTSNDDELKGIMGAATDALIDFMNRDPRVADFNDTVNGTGIEVVPVRQYPVLAVAQVQVGDLVLDPALYTFDDYTVRRKGAPFPRGHRNVTVSYTAGLDPVPKTLREAYLMTVKAMWMARGVNPNATGESWAGVSSEVWYADGAGAVPPAARSLVRSLVRTISVP